MYDVGAHEIQRGVNDLRDCQKFSCPATNHRRHRNSNFYIVEATGRQKTRESGRQNLRSSSAPQDHVRKCTASVRTYMRYVHVLCDEEVNSSKFTSTAPKLPVLWRGIDREGGTPTGRSCWKSEQVELAGCSHRQGCHDWPRETLRG